MAGSVQKTLRVSGVALRMMSSLSGIMGPSYTMMVAAEALWPVVPQRPLRVSGVAPRLMYLPSGIMGPSCTMMVAVGVR